MKVAVLCLLVASAMTCLAAGELFDVRSNGCSTFGLMPKYSRIFRPACNKHDDCYDACRGQAKCDNDFFQDMRRICRGSSERSKCEKKAVMKCASTASSGCMSRSTESSAVKKFYGAVRMFGEHFYKC